MVALATEAKDDDTQWLTYWTVYALFSLADAFADSIMHVLPLYWVIKCVFLAGLYLPAVNGADTLYRRFIRPAFARYYGSSIKIGGPTMAIPAMMTSGTATPVQSRSFAESASLIPQSPDATTPLSRQMPLAPPATNTAS